MKNINWKKDILTQFVVFMKTKLDINTVIFLNERFISINQYIDVYK